VVRARSTGEECNSSFKKDEMRKPLSVAVICLLASVVLAATGNFQPLKVKTGLWQMTETATWTSEKHFNCPEG
jgi:hypothetical protein